MFRSDTNNFQIDLLDTAEWTRLMETKGYTTLPRAPEMEPQHQMQSSNIPKRYQTFFFGGERGFYPSASNAVGILDLVKGQ